MALDPQRLGAAIATKMKNLRTQAQYIGHDAPYTDDETARWQDFAQKQAWTAMAAAIITEFTQNASVSGSVPNGTMGSDTLPFSNGSIS